MFGLWVFRDEKLQRDIEFGVEATNHGNGQLSLAVEYFRYPWL